MHEYDSTKPHDLNSPPRVIACGARIAAEVATRAPGAPVPDTATVVACPDHGAPAGVPCHVAMRAPEDAEAERMCRELDALANHIRRAQSDGVVFVLPPDAKIEVLSVDMGEGGQDFAKVKAEAERAIEMAILGSALPSEALGSTGSYASTSVYLDIVRKRFATHDRTHVTEVDERGRRGIK